MPPATIAIDKSLLGGLKDMTPDETKLFLLIALLANPEGYARTSLKGLSEMARRSQWVTSHLVSRLASKHIISYKAASSPVTSGIIQVRKYLVPEGTSSKDQAPGNLPVGEGEGDEAV